MILFNLNVRTWIKNGINVTKKDMALISFPRKRVGLTCIRIVLRHLIIKKVEFVV